jgi:hypothetical protein
VCVRTCGGEVTFYSISDSLWAHSGGKRVENDWRRWKTREK